MIRRNFLFHRFTEPPDQPNSAAKAVPRILVTRHRPPLPRERIDRGTPVAPVPDVAGPVIPRRDLVRESPAKIFRRTISRSEIPDPVPHVAAPVIPRRDVHRVPDVRTRQRRQVDQPHGFMDVQIYPYPRRDVRTARLPRKILDRRFAQRISFPQESLGCDSLRIHLTGAVSYAGTQADRDQSLGGFRSSTEIDRIGLFITGKLSGIVVLEASGANRIGRGSISTSANQLTYSAPSGTPGPKVVIESGETKTLEDGSDPSKFVRVTRTSTDDLIGGLSIEFNDIFNNLIGGKDGNQTTRTIYRAFMLENATAAEITNLSIYLGTLAPRATSSANGLPGSGTGTIKSNNTEAFCSWPDNGWARISTSAEVLKEIVYFAWRTEDTLHVTASGYRARLGTSAAAGTTTDLVDCVPGTSIAVEAASPVVHGSIQTIASETTAPTGLTWSTGISTATGLSITSIGDCHNHGVWIEYDLPAGAAATPELLNQILLSFTQESKSYTETLSGLYRIEDPDLVGYGVWISTGSDPDPENTAPTEVTSTDTSYVVKPSTVSIAAKLFGSFGAVLEWTSTQPTPVDFRVYRDGVRVSSSKSSNGSGSIVLPLGPGEHVDLEVLDRACLPAPKSYPSSFTLNWRSVDGADSYRVEEFVNSVWTARETILDQGRTYYSWTSRYLENETTHQFRIIPIKSLVDGTALSFSVTMVRRPAPVEWTGTVNPSRSLTVNGPDFTTSTLLQDDAISHVVVRRRTKYGLWDGGIDVKQFKITSGSGDELAPSAPHETRCWAAGSGVIRITSVYLLEIGADALATVQADQFVIYASVGVDPDPSTDTPVATLTMAKSEGLGMFPTLYHDLTGYSDGNDVRVIVRTRRSTDLVESTNVGTCNAIAVTQALTAPDGSAHWKGRATHG